MSLIVSFPNDDTVWFIGGVTIRNDGKMSPITTHGDGHIRLRMVVDRVRLVIRVWSMHDDANRTIGHVLDDSHTMDYQ